MAKKTQEEGRRATARRAAAPSRVVAHPRARDAASAAGAAAPACSRSSSCTLLSLRAGVPAFDAVLRGLAGGVAAQFVAWVAGVIAWRHLILAELAVHREARAAAAAERRAPRARARAAERGRRPRVIDPIRPIGPAARRRAGRAASCSRPPSARSAAASARSAAAASAASARRPSGRRTPTAGGLRRARARTDVHAPERVGSSPARPRPIIPLARGETWSRPGPNKPIIKER